MADARQKNMARQVSLFGFFKKEGETAPPLAVEKKMVQAPAPESLWLGAGDALLGQLNHDLGLDLLFMLLKCRRVNNWYFW